MKTHIALILAAVSLLFSGCATATQKNAGAFLAKVAAMDITAADVSQSTMTPLYSHKESIAGLQKSENKFSVSNLKAEFAIPLWGVQWTFTASAITGSKAADVAAVATAAGGTGVAVTQPK